MVSNMKTTAGSAKRAATTSILVLVTFQQALMMVGCRSEEERKIIQKQTQEQVQRRTLQARRFAAAMHKDATFACHHNDNWTGLYCTVNAPSWTRPEKVICKYNGCRIDRM